MILYVVRHGQPLGHDGSPASQNPGLSPVGIQQAERAAEQIAKWGIDALVSSAHQRAIETALPLRERTGAPWFIWGNACETERRGWPEVRTLTRTERERRRSARAAEVDLRCHRRLSELGATYGADVKQTDGWPDEWWRPLFAETRQEAYARAGRVYLALLAAYDAEHRVALVCHGAFASMLLTVMMDCGPADHNRFSHTHGAISRIDVEPGGAVSLRMLNDMRHLEGLITEGLDTEMPRFPR